MIPVATLYYFLCYAWNRLPEPAVLQATAATPFHRPLGLLAQVLLHGTRRLLTNGLPRSFATEEAELGRLRGRIELAPTLGRGLLLRGRAICSFDELSPNSPFHRMLFQTLTALAAADLPLALRREVSAVRQRFPTVIATAPAGQPDAATFRELRRLRPGGQVAFLLHVCELVWQTALPAPTAGGRSRFVDFRRDEVLMARLFEQFTRNFFRREQRRYRVYAETIAWQAEGPTDDLALLPTMLTDTTLEADDRKIILDTKYYAAALRQRYDRQRLIAPHLYQLYAYLQNQVLAPGQSLEGILLYPAVTQTVDARYTLGGHPVRVVTLNLHQPWSGIAADLLALVH